MPVESAADRLTFLSPDEFGEVGTYTPVGGSAVSGLTGILNDPHISILFTGDAPTSDRQPTFLCRTADLPIGAQGGDAGDALDLAANDLHPVVTYRVIDLQPDGAGMTLLFLGS